MKIFTTGQEFKWFLIKIKEITSQEIDADNKTSKDLISDGSFLNMNIPNTEGTAAEIEDICAKASVNFNFLWLNPQSESYKILFARTKARTRVRSISNCIILILYPPRYR